MRPSIRWLLPVPVSEDGGAWFAAAAGAPWMVNRTPPTEFDVWIPVYVTPDWTEVPACRYRLDVELPPK